LATRGHRQRTGARHAGRTTIRVTSAHAQTRLATKALAMVAGFCAISKFADADYLRGW
jgi:hypothetical protein